MSTPPSRAHTEPESGSDTWDQLDVPKYRLRVTPPPRSPSSRRLSGGMPRLSAPYVDVRADGDDDGPSGFDLSAWGHENPQAKSKAASKSKSKTLKKPKKPTKATRITKTKPKTKAKRIRRTSYNLLLAAAKSAVEQRGCSRPSRRMYEGKYMVDKLSVAPRKKNMVKSEEIQGQGGE